MGSRPRLWLPVVVFLAFAAFGAGEAAAENDIQMTKADSDDPVPVGQNFDYVITAHNVGPDDATNVDFSDTIPASLEIVSASACGVTGQTVSCSIASLPSGTSFQVTVTVPGTQVETVSNTAEIDSVSGDQNETNNTDTEMTTISAPPPPPDDDEEEGHHPRLAAAAAAEDPNALASCPIGTSLGVVCVANAFGGFDITGTPGDDVIVGSEGPDVIRAGKATTRSTVAVAATGSMPTAGTTRRSAARAPT